MKWIDGYGDEWVDALPRYPADPADRDVDQEPLENGTVVRDGDAYVYSDTVVDVVQ